VSWLLEQGSYYYYNGERIAQGREKAQQHLKDNPDLAKEIEAEVSAAFALVREHLEMLGLLSHVLAIRQGPVSMWVLLWVHLVTMCFHVTPQKAACHVELHVNRLAVASVA
jgi:hypothetical protein